MRLQKIISSVFRPAAIIVFGLLIVACQSDQVKKTPEAEASDPVLAVIDAARWAQNAHNVQSWRFWRTSPESVQGGLDPARLLPNTDPKDRQLILSLGALTETARVAARSKGLVFAARWIAPVGWNPRAEPGIPAFEWRIEASGSASRAGAAGVDAVSSPTVKYKVKPARLVEGFADGGISRFDRNGARFFIVEKGPLLVRVLALAREAYQIEMTNGPTLMESVNYSVYGVEARRRHPYGITLLGNFDRAQLGFVEFLARAFPQSPEEYGRSGMKMIGKVLDSCEQLVVMVSPANGAANDPGALWEAGQPMESMWDEVIADGLSLLPLSQGLQEPEQYAEVRKALQGLLANEGETVQMIWAVGKPDGKFLRAPRIDARDLLVAPGSGR